MFKPKNSVVAFAAGFVLSFFISLLSTHRFGTSFARAVIFGLVFLGISFLVSIIDKKLLDGGSSDNSDSVEPVKKTQRTSGNNIDITIDDENFTEDDSPPQFDVDKSKFGGAFSTSAAAEVAPVKAAAAVNPVAASSVSSEVPVAASVSSNSVSPSVETVSSSEVSSTVKESVTSSSEEFTPVPLGTPIDKTPKTAAERRQAERAASQQEIDSLPDLGSFGSSSSDDSGSADIIQDSDFAQQSSSGSDSSSSIANGSSVDISGISHGDTTTIAKAIQTLLRKDEA